MVQYEASWLSQVPHGSVGTACRGRQGSVAARLSRLQHGLAVLGLAEEGAAWLSRVRRAQWVYSLVHFRAPWSRVPIG